MGGKGKEGEEMGGEGRGGKGEAGRGQKGGEGKGNGNLESSRMEVWFRPCYIVARSLDHSLIDLSVVCAGRCVDACTSRHESSQVRLQRCASVPGSDPRSVPRS